MRRVLGDGEWSADAAVSTLAEDGLSDRSASIRRTAQVNRRAVEAMQRFRRTEGRAACTLLQGVVRAWEEGRGKWQGERTVGGGEESGRGRGR